MHLLAAQPGSIDDGQEPVDPNQTPADIIFISAADTELVCLSEARSALAEKAPTIRLINMLHLKHPMSVDLHLDQCATKSKLVVARILGGTGYWKYGVEQYSAMLSDNGVPFVALPGDDNPDDELWRLSTVTRNEWEALLAYFVEGGTQNISNALLYSKSIIEKTIGKKATKNYLEMQPGDVTETAANINNLSEITGFKPSISIEDGIPKFISWYNSFHN